MITLDIETAPQSRALLLEYPRAEREYPKNYKNAEAIDRWYADDEAQWRSGLAKAAALNPRLGRIVAVGACVNGDAPRVLVELTEASESILICYAMAAIAGNRLVTFNGLSFDLPYLHVRAAVNGIKIPYCVSDYVRRYTAEPHADLSAILTNWNPHHREGDTLHGWCEAFGIPVIDQTTGADIDDAVTRGDITCIEAHCASDLTLTRTLGERLLAAGLLPRNG